MMKTGVVLLNMGGPKDGSEVKPFLRALFSDPYLIRLPARPLLAPLIVALRAGAARRRYGAIPGGSPLLSISLAQAAELERRLRESITEVWVRVGMRYTSPSIEESVGELVDKGCRRIVGLSMYPQYCKATTGSSLAELRRVTKGRTEIDLLIVDRYYDVPGYIDAVVDTIRSERNENADLPFVLFSAHGIPTRLLNEGDPYVEETRCSVNRIADCLGLDKSRFGLAFQSRVGPVKWVGPSTEEVISDLARDGVRDLLLVPISFTVDNLETLFDMDVVLKKKAESLGFENVSRAGAVNANPAFIRTLAGLVGKVQK